jgi:hypothetical protein
MKDLQLKLEFLVSRIHLIRGQKVMLDKDLAQLYDVTTGNLNKAVKRNLKWFPPDFMFRLAASEQRTLIFQIGINWNIKLGREPSNALCIYKAGCGNVVEYTEK